MDENQAIVIIDNDTGQLSAGIAPPPDEERLHIDLDYAIEQWLAAKLGKSGSQRTYGAYRQVIDDYRAALQFKSLDLDSVERAATRNAQLLVKTMLKDVASTYANFSKQARAIAPATRNTRYAILSSFYRFCIKQEWFTYNPMEHIERAEVQPYAESKALDAEDVAEAMQAIDQTDERGKRDYALLAVYLDTGCRLSEVAGLTWANVTMKRGKQASILFKKTKGNKSIQKPITQGTARALRRWLESYYRVPVERLAPETPLWVSLARGYARHTQKPSYGEPLGIQAIADICLKHLGVSKVHSTRHTWVVEQLNDGANLEEIRQGLGHASIATTGIYSASLKVNYNQDRAERIAARLGIK